MELLSLICEEYVLRFSDCASARFEAPLKEPVEPKVASTTCEGSYFQKGKDSSFPETELPPRRELLESDNLALVSTTPNNVNQLLVSPPDQPSGIEQQIISSIKTFRKGN